VMRDVELDMRTFVFPEGSVVVQKAGEMWAWTVVCGDETVMGEYCCVTMMAARAHGWDRLLELATEGHDD
jgi:hypothetical protein